MSTTTTPNWTDTGAAVIATASLARNAVTSGVVDTRAKPGLRLLIRLARTGTTALTGSGLVVVVRPTFNNNAQAHPGQVWSATSQIAAANSTTINADVSAAGTTLNVASTTGFAPGDLACVGQGTAREEWCRVARVTDATHLLIDRGTEFAHTAAQADTVVNKADCWTVELPGGTVWEVVLDYGAATAGDSYRVHVVKQTYDSLTTA